MAVSNWMRPGNTPAGPVPDQPALSLEAYRALYENNPDGVLFTVPDGRILAANPAACRILGRSETEIRRIGRQGLADETDERWNAMLADRGRTGHVEGVGRMVCGDGRLIEVEIGAQVFRDAAGAERACIILRDVTERVGMENALRASEARLAEAERVAQIGSWEWDIPGGQVTWSQGLYRLYGLTPQEFDPTFEGALKRIDPGDRDRVSNAIRRALTNRSGFEVEYRMRRADGRLRTLNNRADIVVDEDGNPVRMVGIAQDITEAKLARAVLESASSDLERRAVELHNLALQTSESSPPRSRSPLTARQLEVLALVARGLTSAQIASRLFVSEATVKWHVKQILAKTGSANRAEAVAHVLGPQS